MRKFAAFDFDGTLIRWQLYHAAVDRLAKRGLLGEGAHDEIRDHRKTWKQRKDPESFKVYQELLVKRFTKSLSTLSTKDFDQIAKEVVEEYKDQIYTYTKQLILDLREKDYFLIAISGSHQELVEPIAKYYGFDAYVGSSHPRAGDYFTGTANIASNNKRDILTEMITKNNLTREDSYAIGDTESDIPLLEMVDNPIAFNPNKELLDVAKKNMWPIIIERKNVIYTLKPDASGYRLQV